jgi:hypothetical protein
MVRPEWPEKMVRKGLPDPLDRPVQLDPPDLKGLPGQRVTRGEAGNK